MIEQRFVVTCSVCGKMVFMEEAAGWQFLTQPTVATCPRCVAEKEAAPEFKENSESS